MEPNSFLGPRDLTPTIPDDVAAVPAGPPKVGPLTPRLAMPAPMVTDLLAGDLRAGFALLEWLEERAAEPVRADQLVTLRRLLGDLVTAANGENVILYHDIPWAVFAGQVRSLFALDLYHADDLIRFLDAALRPGWKK